MQYRQFKNGDKVSLLGVGTMRLPCLDNGEIDRPAAIKMIRDAIDKGGVNYVDTAYKYHDGDSEVLVGEALKDGYREKVYLADKMPVWLVKNEEELTEIFQEQLRRLNTDKIDYYLAHNLTKQIWKIAQKHNLMSFLDNLKATGKVGNVGFSFHDDFETFKEIVDAYPWDFCQIQLNYMDKNYQAGVAGLKYAAEKGIPVVIMEPLKGGKLTNNIPPEIAELWKEAKVQRTPAEWALSWVANFKEVVCILSGMSNYEQMEQNVQIMDKALPESLTVEELELIDKVSDKYNSLIKYSCTGCKYCIPCEKKIMIPDIIELCNDYNIYGDTPAGHMSYSWQTPGRTAGNCIECGVCEEKCPQHLPIREIMKETAEIFGY